MTALKIANQRALIDRRAVASRIDEIAAQDAGNRAEIVAILAEALEKGRGDVRRRLLERPSAGHDCCRAQAFLIDQIVRLACEYVTAHVYPPGNASAAEALTAFAVGGYGRAEMAPHSDVDIAFVTPHRRTPWCEQVIEAVLYLLWDLKLKVGHSSRSVDETIRMAKTDMTIRTTLLEGRYVWGNRALYDEAARRFRREVTAGTDAEFIAAKLEERNARHRRMGDSRYVVEPNVKDGKGGLRDLHALYWIGKHMHRVDRASELVDAGLLTRAEYRSFRRADGFMLAVRCHLHDLTGRAEDRLTFDLQRQVADRMNFADRPGKSAVERFMQFYFLQAKRVGSLTAVFLSHIEAELDRRSGPASFFRRPERKRSVEGFIVTGGKIAAPADDWFERDPVRLIQIFQLAEEHGCTIDPDTMRQIDRDSRLIDRAVRADERANALFLDLLSGRRDPETVLRWMNEAGVFGRFVPDFGKVNAQMQFDMYHHYTVDEHTIRAIGLLARIEKGELAEDHPRATRLIHRVQSRRAAYVAILLHDIAKGRGGDHSELGADIARRLCPRFGLDEAETDLVAWLVLNHLLMSATAFKRDLADPKTIEDFVARVQSPERLRHLAILTAVDIRAVGPGVWNSWKGQLLGQLFDTAEEQLRLGHVRHNREARIAAKRADVATLLGERAALVERATDWFDDAYWIAEPSDIIALNLVHYEAARSAEHQLSIHCEYYEARGATLVTVIAADHPGVFYRVAGGIHLAGGNIIDARIHTTRTGWAVDNFLVQDPLGNPFGEQSQFARLERSIADALANRGDLVPKLAQRPLPRNRAKAFDVSPRVSIDNDASNRFTVIEVNARDRAALLNRLGRALFENGLLIHSAHVTNYGERANDTFYVTDTLGGKVLSADRLAQIEQALLTASSDERQAELEPA